MCIFREVQATAVKEQTVAIGSSVSHCLLDTTNSLLDRYLPEEMTKQKPGKGGVVIHVCDGGI